MEDAAFRKLPLKKANNREALDQWVKSLAAGKRHTISQNLGSIHQQLNPKKFFKINRSEIVNIDFIDKIESHFKNRLLISITNHKEKVMTSSSTTSDFRKWLEQ